MLCCYHKFIKLYNEPPEWASRGEDLNRQAKAIVVRLARMEMPSEPKQLSEFTTLVNNMASFLETIWCKSSNPQELMYSCLVLIYELITESGLWKQIY